MLNSEVISPLSAISFSLTMFWSIIESVFVSPGDIIRGRSDQYGAVAPNAFAVEIVKMRIIDSSKNKFFETTKHLELLAFWVREYLLFNLFIFWFYFF